MSAWAELNILTSKQIKQFFANKRLRKPVNRGGRPHKTPITVINGRRVRQRALPVLALAALLLASPVLCFAALLLWLLWLLRCFCSCRSPSNLQSRRVLCSTKSTRVAVKRSFAIVAYQAGPRPRRCAGARAVAGKIFAGTSSVEATATSAAELLVPEAAA